MNKVLINEQRIQEEVERIKLEFSDTKDIYREVCVILFFRYGMTPTANKLYQYVRKGSMSAPADALNKFWLELREKSRVRIERTDIPENISNFAGDFIANLWNEAQKAAQAGFSELAEKALAQTKEFQIKSESALHEVIELKETLLKSENELKNSQKRLIESENKLAVDRVTLTDKEKSLVALRNEKSLLETELKRLQGEFIAISDKLHISLALSDERYRALESKALTEVDRERQRANNLFRELHKVNQTLSKARIDNLGKLHKNEAVVNLLKERIGTLKGQLKESQKNQISAMKIINNFKMKNSKVNESNL